MGLFIKQYQFICYNFFTCYREWQLISNNGNHKLLSSKCFPSALKKLNWLSFSLFSSTCQKQLLLFTHYHLIPFFFFNFIQQILTDCSPICQAQLVLGGIPWWIKLARSHFSWGFWINKGDVHYTENYIMVICLQSNG